MLSLFIKQFFHDLAQEELTLREYMKEAKR